MRTRFAAALFGAVSLLSCPLLRAEPHPAARRAERLFRAGKASMEAEDFNAACPQFAESEALDPQPGTLLNLATCYEGLGRTASAWSTWLQAADAAAAKEETEREAFARYRASQLEPHLVRVTVNVAEQRGQDRIDVGLDRAPLPRDAWGAPRPIDPGEHEVSAAGQGLRPWMLRFVVDPQTPPVTVLVPVLEPVVVTAVAARATAPARGPRGRVLVPVAWTVGGLGLAALGLGAAFGVSAIVQENRSNEGGNCRPNNACNAEGASARNAARQDAQLADVSFAVGGGALVTAVTLWLLSMNGPDHQSAPATVVVQPSVARDTWGVSINGAW